MDHYENAKNCRYTGANNTSHDRLDLGRDNRDACLEPSMIQPWLVLDIETTGLDPETDLICELAYIHVKADLLECCSQQFTVNGDGQIAKLHGNDYVLAMHEQSGLFDELRETENGYSMRSLDMELAYAFKTSEQIILVGNSIHFDRSFIKKHLPKFEKLLHHRMVDVSSLKLVAERFDPDDEANRVKHVCKHRALADCYDSLEQLRGYVNYYFSPPPVASNLDPSGILDT